MRISMKRGLSMRMGPSWIESARRKWLFTFCVTPATYLRCVCVCVCVCVREREREWVCVGGWLMRACQVFLSKSVFFKIPIELSYAKNACSEHCTFHSLLFAFTHTHTHTHTHE